VMMVPMAQAMNPILSIVFNIPHNLLDDKEQYNTNCMEWL
jgi:hypothetical protein